MTLIPGLTKQVSGLTVELSRCAEHSPLVRDVGRRLPSNLSRLASWYELRIGPIGTFRFYNILDILTILGNKMKCEWNQPLWSGELDKLRTFLGWLYYEVVVGV